jgi:methionyl-tRNA synthetase
MNPTEDGDFSQEKFRDRYNADLADGLGNLVARVFSMALKSQIKLSDSIKIRPSFIKEIEKTSEKKNELMSEFKFNSALEEIWKLISFADKYIERNRPWERREGSDLIIKELIYLIYSIGKMIEPFMPKTSAKIFNQISQGERDNLFEKI